MMATPSINLLIERSKSLKPKPSENNLGFGQQFTDHMLITKFTGGSWKVGEIKPFEHLNLSPATAVFHYGQALFEGLKAFKQNDGTVAIFRPVENAKRLNLTAKRLVMPTLNEEYFVDSLRQLIKIETDWVPSSFGTSLYIRPTMIATDPQLGVKPSNDYLYFVILSPSGSYFANGFQPSKILVEDKYIRAAPGGTGGVKAAGNYAGSMLAAQIAKRQGYSQVLWLDSKDQKFVEEVGAMNIAFVLDDEVHSPKPNETILDGVTRRSVQQISDDLGIKFNENSIDIENIVESIKSGNLTEIFGIGTAASISPVGELKFKNEKLIVNNNEVGPIAESIYKELTGIQYGKIEDRHNWLVTC